MGELVTRVRGGIASGPGLDRFLVVGVEQQRNLLVHEDGKDSCVRHYFVKVVVCGLPLGSEEHHSVC